LRKVHYIEVVLIVCLFCLSNKMWAQDTIPSQIAQKQEKLRHIFKPEPLKATMLAVAFPGLGQVYNRKYWKIPLVYAGFGALIYSISVNGKNYNTMMKAYQDFTDNIPATDSYISLITWAKPQEYDPVLYPKDYNPSNAAWVKDNLLQAVDYYKKYRDLSYIGIAAWYIITIIDANVDASLFNYDISNKLDLTLYPSRIPVAGVFGAGLNISLKYTF